MVVTYTPIEQAKRCSMENFFLFLFFCYLRWVKQADLDSKDYLLLNNQFNIIEN